MIGKSFLGLGVAFAVIALVLGTTATAGVVPFIDDGYLDRFDLADGRKVDIGELNGGIIGNPTADKISVVKQGTSAGPWPPEVLPSDGRLTGIVHGKFRVVNLGDRTLDGFINGDDVDDFFDVAWQLVEFDKQQGPGTADFKPNVTIGPELTVGFDPVTRNFPPSQGGSNSIFSMAACSTEGGIDVDPDLGPRENCFEFAAGLDFDNLPGGVYTGWVDYTFPISIPGVSDSNPGLGESDSSWVITALLSPLAFSAFPVQFGTSQSYDPDIAIEETQDDLVRLGVPMDHFAFPGDTTTQNVPFATLLTSVQIDVIPEPGTLALLGIAAVGLLRRRP
ncbi:MAG: PEP-CTERM sorting domain-containing protein [Planctomycetota bacterium]|nr:PEP-CTERM sorting domain-containing protein [Planctomycetota bacterium]